MRAANKESPSSDSSSRGSLEDVAGDDMLQRYIREFPMTAVEGSLMYKLERKDTQPCKIGGEVRRFVVLHYYYLFIRCCARQAESVGRRDRCVETT